MTTLKQQIKIVHKASQYFDGTPFQDKLMDVKQTLLSVQILGEEKIKLLPVLLTVCEDILERYDDQDTYMQQLQQIIGKIKTA